MRLTNEGNFKTKVISFVWYIMLSNSCDLTAYIELIEEKETKAKISRCKNPVVKTKVSDVWVQMLVFSDSENGCMQGSFLKRTHARVFLVTDAHNQKGHFD